MHESESERMRSAYLAAMRALKDMRSAMVAAGILEDDSEVQPEGREERRRRLARERARRSRASRGSVTDSVTKRDVSRDSVTQGVTKRDADGLGSVTKRDAERDASRKSVTESVTERDAPASRVCARSSSEEIKITPPLCYAKSPPPNAGGDDDTHSGVTLAGPPPVASEGGSTSAAPVVTGRRRRKGQAREPAALRPGAAIDASLVSEVVPGTDRAPAGASVDREPSEADRVWSAYAEAVAPTRPRRTETRVALIERRLREYPVEELIRSIVGYGRSAFHRGENDRGRPYQTIELWLRDAAHVEAGWSYLDRPVDRPATRPVKKGAPILDGIEAEWQKVEARLEADRDVFAEL